MISILTYLSKHKCTGVFIPWFHKISRDSKQFKRAFKGCHSYTIKIEEKIEQLEIYGGKSYNTKNCTIDHYGFLITGCQYTTLTAGVALSYHWLGNDILLLGPKISLTVVYRYFKWNLSIKHRHCTFSCTMQHVMDWTSKSNYWYSQ